MRNHQVDLYTFLFRDRVIVDKIKAIGGTINHVCKYSPIATVALEHPKQLKKITDDPDLIDVRLDQQTVLPFFRIDEIMSPRLVAKTKKNIYSQVVPWNVRRVLGSGRPNTGRGIRIGVIDTGIDYRHPDIGSNVKGGVNIVNPGRNFIDDNGHGTHISGTIGALNNKIGVVGVAPNVSLYAIKVLDTHGVGTVNHLIQGIEWGIAKGMHILNISISGGQVITPAMTKVIQEATKRGIVIVAAAGNSGHPSGRGDTVQIPGRIKPVIAVAALKSNNGRDTYSATGPSVDIAAPGTKILSTYSGNQYAVLTGTSMATAHVSGAVAIYRLLYPKLGVKGIRHLLKTRAIDLPPKGYDYLTGSGLVQVR